MTTTVIMPQLGESVVEGTVTKWLRRVGESVQELEPILEVDTDKVDTEIPSPASGVLLKIVVPEGTTVKAGTILAWIGQPNEKIPAETSELMPTDQTRDVSAKDSQTQTILHTGKNHDLGFISPVVAKLAREHNIDLTKVKASGEGGRITKRDILAFLEAQSKTQPQPPARGTASAIPPMEIWETPADGDLFRPTEFYSNITSAPSGPEIPGKMSTPQLPQEPGTPSMQLPTPVPEKEDGTIVPLTAIRKSIAEHMVNSKQTSPHVTTVMEADLSKVLAHFEANKSGFESNGTRLTYTAYFISAVVSALREFPIVNTSWTEQGILFHRQINIGMAVALENEGLIVPVIKKADERSLLGLARAVNDLALLLDPTD